MIMRDLDSIYEDMRGKIGLKSISKDLSIDLNEYVKRTKVLIVGNQSSGKSQFVNCIKVYVHYCASVCWWNNTSDWTTVKYNKIHIN